MTTYNSTTRNTTDFDEALATGRITYLTTDTPEYILVGENEDEILILWNATSFSGGARNATTFSSVARN